MSTLTAQVTAHLAAALEVKRALLADPALAAVIADASERCIASLRLGGRILVAGNGGSAADAQHIAGELVARFYYDRPAMAGIALTTDSSVLTAIGNDYGYERLFSRQVEALGRPGDVLILLSTSGNSPNILAAAVSARLGGLATIGLTGAGGGRLRAAVDCCVCIPADDTPRIQEAHILVGHILCALMEAGIHPRPSAASAP